jgi:hypothetical protein
MEPGRRALLRFAVSSALASPLIGAPRAAETEEAVDIKIQDAAAKVGEPAYVLARIVPHAGFEIASNYRNRLGQLSANENAVEFKSPVVGGTVEGGALVFKVAVIPKRTGPNAINGVFRFAFVSEADGQRRLDIKSAPLIATVTGTQ